jgi:hypothetical protein
MGRTAAARRWSWAVTAAAAVAALGVTAPAWADPQYDLKLKVDVDQQWSFQQTSTMSMTVQVGNGGGQQVQQSADQKRTGTVTVLAVQDGAATALKVAFGPDCGQSGKQNGQQQDQPFPLAGKTVQIKKDDLGIVQIDGAATDPATTNELSNMLTPDRSLYPPHPVSVGDEWTGDSTGLAKQMGLGPNDSVAVKCKLARIGSVDGRPTADVTVNVVGTKTENGVTTKMTLDGTAQADLATGQTLQADLGGTMAISGQADTPQGQQPVSGDGKLELHQSVRPVGGVAAAPAAPVPTIDVAPPGGGAVNPLAAGGADAPDRFTGTFKNDKIAVELAPAGGGSPSYAGTIKIGDHGCPATAQAGADGKLVGTFESGGNKFDFTATVDGLTMQLTSGQNTFSLQKNAPPNPLDALGGSAPVNPLAR